MKRELHCDTVAIGSLRMNSHSNACPKKSAALKVINGQRHHFSILYDAVLDDYGAILKPHGLATYWALLRFASKDGQCYPSHQTIAERTGMSIRQVRVCLKHLATLGLIRITMRRPRTSIYTIMDVPERHDNGQDMPNNNRQVVPINRQVVPINLQDMPIEPAGGAYEVDVVEVDPPKEIHPTTPPPTPSAEIMAPISTDVGEVVAPLVAIAEGEEAKTTDGHMADAMTPTPFDAFFVAYPHHRALKKARATWQQQGLDAELDRILEALSWQQELTGTQALPLYPHVHLENKGWLDARPVAASARPFRDWDAPDAAPAGPQCKERDCLEVPGHLSDTRCDRHAMVTINEEATRLLRALKAHGSESTIDVLEDAIWHEVEHYHKNGDFQVVMESAVICYQSIGESLYVEFLAQDIARVVEKYRAEHPRDWIYKVGDIFPDGTRKGVV